MKNIFSIVVVKPKYIFLLAIIVILVLAIITIFIGSRTNKQLPKQSPQQTANKESLFGTMIAFNINEAAMSTPGMIDSLQKGWTEFRKDNSAYQNLKSNLKKLIQDRIKFVKATSFSLDREFFPYFWNVIEPQKGQFNWELTDLYAQAASNAGVKISAIIQPFASWDQNNTLPLTNCNALDFVYYDYKAGPPNDLAEYKNFLTKIVERYKNTVAVWEIGNEVEGDCGGYKNNPQGYVALLKISYETIKKADPKAKVLNGGALEFGEARSFWQQFFALGGGQYTDYFNLHYNAARSPDARLDPATFQEDLTFFNNLMEKNGGKKPLYLTEFGIYSGVPSSQPLQPLGQPIQGAGQVQINLPTQPTPPEQFSNQPLNDKCGDNICDDFEKQNPNACPRDCQTSTQQPAQQPQSKKSILNQNLPKLSQESQAALYFKYSILAFANGVKVVFIDLIGPDNGVVGSSMAFNTNGQPRLFLTNLKMIDSKISGFSKAEKITDGQYKFTVGSKTVYVLWSGALPNEISGRVKVTNIKGQEQILDAVVVKLNADQPVLIEL